MIDQTKYFLEDMGGQPTRGGFYEHELQIATNNDVYFKKATLRNYMIVG